MRKDEQIENRYAETDKILRFGGWERFVDPVRDVITWCLYRNIFGEVERKTLTICRAKFNDDPISCRTDIATELKGIRWRWLHELKRKGCR